MHQLVVAYLATVVSNFWCGLYVLHANLLILRVVEGFP